MLCLHSLCLLPSATHQTVPGSTITSSNPQRHSDRPRWRRGCVCWLCIPPGLCVATLCVHNDTPMVLHKFLDQLHCLHVFFFSSGPAHNLLSSLSSCAQYSWLSEAASRDTLSSHLCVRRSYLMNVRFTVCLLPVGVTASYVKCLFGSSVCLLTDRVGRAVVENECRSMSPR